MEKMVNDEGLSPVVFSVICNNKDYVEYFYSLGLDVNPSLSVQNVVHDRGVLSNDYKIYCGKAIYVQKRRVCADNLLSYSSVNNCLNGLKGINEWSAAFWRQAEAMQQVEKYASVELMGGTKLRRVFIATSYAMVEVETFVGILFSLRR